MADLVEFREFRDDDACALIANMRPTDVLEWSAMMGFEPRCEAMVDMARKSTNVRVFTLNGEVTAIYGVQSKTILGTDGLPWLLGTNLLDTKSGRRVLLRHSVEQAAVIFRGFSELWNFISVENRIAIRWLKFLGFEAHHHIPQELNGVTFIPFTMRV